MSQLPVADFLTQRLSEYDAAFSVRPGTGFHRLFFKPMQFITQPIIDEADRLRTAQSLVRILEQDDPDAFDEEEVDALVGNVYIARFQGGFSSGTARVYYPEAVSREWPANGILITGANGVTYTNPTPFVITAAQMGQQIEDGNFYYDIPITSSVRGDDTELEEEQLVSVTNDPDVISVTNKNRVSGGRDRETNTELIERARSSIGVRTLSVGKGFRGTLFDAFPSFLLELQPIGFGDREMMRDIVFNTHIGGKTDGYFKASSITKGSKNFIGLLIDTTRQTLGSSNIELTASDWADLAYPNIDRSGAKDPVVKEVKANFPAEFTSTADLSSPVDLSTNQHIKLTIDGVAKNIRVAGLSEASTSRNEIVAIINAAFGIDVAFTSGNEYILLQTPSQGLNSQIVIDNPDIGNSALLEVFGLATGSAPYTYDGEGPLTFIEGTHYNIDDNNGRVRRVIGAEIVAAGAAGSTLQGTSTLTSSGLFGSVSMNDIVTVTSGSDAGVTVQDYRVVEVTDANTLVLDDVLAPGDTDGTPYAVEFGIRRTGIKDGELVEVEFYFNPLSIDIGDQVLLDSSTNERGVRPGREEQTITDLSFLRITSVELIDPITEEPIGEVLSGESGWGLGGWGEGAFGVGDSADYYVVVNEPTARFSAYEDSYIVFNSGLIGLSFQVNYEYVPEVRTLHAFALSENERDIGGDILMKTFLPAYVSGTIRYSVDETEASIPTNEELQAELKEWIYDLRSAPKIEISDVVQFILQRVDPFNKYGAYVEPFSLSGTIENADGTTAGVESNDILEIPEEDPFPRFTDRPLTPRIARWIAEDLVLERI